MQFKNIKIKIIRNKMITLKPNYVFFSKFDKKKPQNPILIENQEEKHKNIIGLKRGSGSSKKLSDSTKKNIKTASAYMEMLAIKKRIINKEKKNAFAHKLSFITLTLPCLQRHFDTTIKKKCLNQLFVQLRKYYNFKNYIWKAEVQKNNNIHFHIITDSFIPYKHIIYLWNSALNKLGYIKRYSDKFNKMTLNEYIIHNKKLGITDLEIVKKRYKKGVNSHWKHPKTVDVRKIQDSQDIAKYISKYISKDTESRRIIGKKIGISQELNQLKNSHKLIQDELIELQQIEYRMGREYTIFTDYGTLILINYNLIRKFFKKIWHAWNDIISNFFKYEPAEYIIFSPVRNAQIINNR